MHRGFIASDNFIQPSWVAVFICFEQVFICLEQRLSILNPNPFVALSENLEVPSTCKSFCSWACASGYCKCSLMKCPESCKCLAWSLLALFPQFSSHKQPFCHLLLFKIGLFTCCLQWLIFHQRNDLPMDTWWHRRGQRSGQKECPVQHRVTLPELELSELSHSSILRLSDCMIWFCCWCKCW